jgi:hypothetical protein
MYLLTGSAVPPILEVPGWGPVRQERAAMASTLEQGPVLPAQAHDAAGISAAFAVTGGDTDV